jgi:hypothetical protein
LLLEECAERLRLTDAYGERVGQLARVIQALRTNSGETRDSIAVDRARCRCEEVGKPWSSMFPNTAAVPS